MSTISASTTSTTGFKVTSDTTGTLVFQTGASPTTAMTIGSDQIISFTNPPTATGGGSVSTNTAYGTSALAANTTGASNTGIGYQALLANADGTQNTAVGRAALTANISGILNSGFGRSSLLANTSGSYNVAVGGSALASNTTANYNTVVGYQAGYSNTTASSNTYIGRSSGYTNTTGQANTFVGASAGYTFNVTGGTSTYNTFIGYAAGYGTTTGTANTFIGSGPIYGAGEAITTGSKNTIIGPYSGNNGGLDIRTSSNYIVLSDGDGTPWAYQTSGVWNFGYDTTASVSYGAVFLKGSNATNYGPYLRYTNNGTFLADAGDYAAIVGSATHQYAIRCGASGGVYLAATATSWSAISDETQKNIIEPITDGLNKVASLRAVIGSYKSDEENTRHPFLIAQDVQAVLPEAVSQNDHDGESVLGLAYTEVIPLLVAAIKELKAEIDTLKGQA